MTVPVAKVNVIRYERWPWENSPGLRSRFSAALVACFLLLAPYLANLSRDYTRYSYFWRRTDAYCLGLLLLGAAVLVTLAGELVRYTERARFIRVFNHVFLTAFGVGILANLIFLAPKLPGIHWHFTTAHIQSAWMILALLVGYSYGRPHSRILIRCRQLCQIVLPAVPLTFVAFLWNSTYPEIPDPIVPIPRACSVSPVGHNRASEGVYVFLFDEWSYERTFTNKSPLARYPHLSNFARTATVYHDAHAPFSNTETSLPAILLQTTDTADIHDGQTGFRTADGRFHSSRDYTSLFDQFNSLGYYTAMIGSTLPCQSWLGNRVDVCRSHCMYPRGDDLWNRLGLHVFNAMHYSPDPWTRSGYKRLEQRLLYDAHCSLLDNMRNDTHKIVREWPSNVCMFVHVFLPHMPAVLKPDLSFHEIKQTGWRDGDLDQYEANLTAMDAMLGEFMTALRKAGKYDDATIVLTSDHTWRHDPDWALGRLTGPQTHVPLLIKAARQDHAANIDERFETHNLGRLIGSLVCPSHANDVFVTENRVR